MKKQICFLLLICISLLTGCFKEETFEEFFNKSMEEMHKNENDFSYSIIHKEMDVVHKDDAIAIFIENDSHEEKIIIGYFKKENHRWNWIRTCGTKWDSPIKYSYMSKEPYTYLGTIDDNSISEVYVGEEPAKIIEIEENKRFWYAISKFKNTQVQVLKNDGSNEVIEQSGKGWTKVEY